MAPGLRRRGRAPARRACRARPSGEPRLLLWPEAAVTDPLEDARTGEHRAMRPVRAHARRSLLGPNDRLLTGGIAIASRGRRPRRRRRPTASSCSAPGGQMHRPLRQGASRALRRISADAAAAVRDRPVAPRARRHRLQRRARARARSTLGGQWGKVGLQLCYEIIFSGDVVDESNRPRLHLQPVERRLVRTLGTAAASGPGAAARGRGRLARCSARPRPGSAR